MLEAFSNEEDECFVAGEGAEIEDLSFRLVGDLDQGGGAEDVGGGAGLGGDPLTSSNYDSESEAAESERPENASEGAVEDISSSGVSKSSKNGVFYKSSYLRFEFFISMQN